MLPPGTGRAEMETGGGENCYADAFALQTAAIAFGRAGLVSRDPCSSSECP